MVNTVCKNFEGYTKHNLEEAKEARRPHHSSSPRIFDSLSTIFVMILCCD
jgi:hypothetical protein